MSQPMRLDLKHFGQISTMVMSNEGEYVLHSDYELLKAEVERLTDAITRGAIIPDAKPVNANPRKDAEINPFQSPHE